MRLTRNQVRLGFVFGAALVVIASLAFNSERSQAPDSTDSCVLRGAMYFQESGSWPTVKTGRFAGREAREVVREECARDRWAFASPAARQAQVPLRVPSDPGAEYFVLEKAGAESERTIVTKRVGSTDTSFSRRLYDCAAGTVKYLGSGDTLAEMNSSPADPSIGPIVAGSIADFFRAEACG